MEELSSLAKIPTFNKKLTFSKIFHFQMTDFCYQSQDFNPNARGILLQAKC